MPSVESNILRDGDALRFHGALTRPVVAAAFKQAKAQLEGVRRFDIGGLARIDSAGIALLATLAAGLHNRVIIDGLPPGFAELRDVYRLDETLSCAH